MNKVAEALIDGIPPATVDPVAASLTSYNPSIRERIGNSVYDAARYLAMDSIANRLRNDVETGIDFVPVIGDVVGADDASREISAGNYGAGAVGLGLAALGGVPIVGDVAAKGVKNIMKSLPSSSYLNTPIAPTIEQMQSLSSIQDVPLNMARGSQRKMEWDKFNSGVHGEPMFKGYEDIPVAALRRDGEYIIFDGHHRTVNAINEGADSMKMHVIDASRYDPANAGKMPTSNDVNLDEINELLSELGL